MNYGLKIRFSRILLSTFNKPDTAIYYILTIIDEIWDTKGTQWKGEIIKVRLPNKD